MEIVCCTRSPYSHASRIYLSSGILGLLVIFSPFQEDISPLCRKVFGENPMLHQLTAVIGSRDPSPVSLRLSMGPNYPCASRAVFLALSPI